MTSVSYSGSGNSFTYTANVTDVGDPAYTERGFVYSTTTTSPTVGGTNCYQISASGTSSSTGSYNRTDTWYSPNVTRHVRAYLKKSSGAYVYSTNYVTFTTPDVPNSGSYNGFSDNYTSPYKYSAHVTANSIEMKANFDNTGGSPRTASGLIFTTSQSLATATFNPSTIQISTSLSDTATKWVKVSVASSNAYVPVTISGL